MIRLILELLHSVLSLNQKAQLQAFNQKEIGIMDFAPYKVDHLLGPSESQQE